MLAIFPTSPLYSRPARPPTRFQLPSFGGILKIGLQTTPHPMRKPPARTLAELQDRAKLGGRRPSDTVEGTRLNVVWEPAPLVLGIALTVESTMSAPDGLFVVRDPIVAFWHLTQGSNPHRTHKTSTLSA
jgi:mediator of RNA polymerase II transcription subunit 14